MLSTLALLFFQDAASQEIPSAAAAGLGMGFMLVICAVALLFVAAMWKIFTKAGKPGWAALIPIYNLIVLLEIAGKPAWWVILLLIPFVQIVVGVMVAISLAKNFGKGTGYGLGLAFLSPIFYPLLAFSDAQYNPQP